MKQIRIPIIASSLFVALALTGCSGEPSSGDIEKAVKANVEQANQQAKQIGGGLISDKMLTQVHAVNKIGCVAAQDASGYNCDVELDVTAPFVGRSKNIGKIRFVEGSDGWQVTN